MHSTLSSSKHFSTFQFLVRPAPSVCMPISTSLVLMECMRRNPQPCASHPGCGILISGTSCISSFSLILSISIALGLESGAQFILSLNMSAFPPSAATDPILPHDSLVSHIIGICSAMLVLVTLVVFVRSYVRLKLTKGRAGADDWCIIVAWVLALVFNLDTMARKSG